MRAIVALPALKGCEANIRLGSTANNKIDGEKPAVTDNGNYIVDLFFKEPIANAVVAAQELSDTIGVVEHGLFCNMATEVIIAGENGVYAKQAQREV